jgi:hypothetical protein
MNKVLIALLTLGHTAFAGDAGYFSRTCVSGTQRTVLTMLNDYSTEGGQIYTLVVDGVPATYKFSDKSVSESGDDGILTISKNSQKVFKMNFNASTGALTLTIYQDPRVGTIAEHGMTSVTPFDVQLSCKDFWPNP